MSTWLQRRRPRSSLVVSSLLLLLSATPSATATATAAFATCAGIPSTSSRPGFSSSSSSSSACLHQTTRRSSSPLLPPSWHRRPHAMTAAATASTTAASASTGASAGTGGAAAAPPTKRLTLLFVRRANPETGAKEVLLGMKKRGFGQGKWNGFGGKVEPGETVEAAALRELEEEACLKATAAELRGKITFTFQTIPDVLKVHVFEAVGPIAGQPQETEEMRPQWYAEAAMPYDKMWADDRYWVPLFLEGKRFQALFEFDDESTILRYDLRALEAGEELVCE